MTVRPPRPTAAGPGAFPATAARRWPRLAPDVLVVVFLGGVAGGLARYGVTTRWPTPARRFPWATFTVNTAGAFLLALLVVLLAQWSPHRYLRLLLGTGFLGAFTTFSAVMTATNDLLAAGRADTAARYLGGSLLAACGAASFGLLLGRAIVASRHRAGREIP